MELKAMDIEYCVSQLCADAVILGIGIIAYIIYFVRKRNFLYCLFLKKELMYEKYGFTKKRGVLFVEFANIILVFGVIVAGIFLYKFAQDLPNILNHNYLRVQGYTIGQSKGGANVTNERRGLKIRDSQTGEEMSFTIFSGYIEENTYLTVEYLPHTMYGAIAVKE